MSVRRTTLLGLLAALALPALADKLDKDSKKWLEEVTPIILPDERQTYTEQLKDRNERLEFEKIFWARRDPNLETPENEYKTTTFDPRRAEADKRYRVAGRLGAQTDCGRLYVIFGEPDEVKKEQTDNPASRPPETWTFRDRPGMTFQGGQTQVALDGQCKLANPNASRELDRIAGSLVLNPNLSYKVLNGKLTKLADLLPKPSLAQTLLKTPRQDFQVKGQESFVRAADGSTAVFGLVKADAGQLTVTDEGGKRVAYVTVTAQAVDSEGHAKAFDERAVAAPVAADGSVVTGYRMFVKPGSYTLKFGLVDEKSGKGALQSESREVPNLASGELTAGSMLLLSEIVDEVTPDPKDPLGAFVIGKARLVPRFAGLFAPSESVLFFFTASDGALAPAGETAGAPPAEPCRDKETGQTLTKEQCAPAGKPSVTATLSLFKGPKIVARAPETEYTDTIITGSVGPVPLGKYEPGTYTAKLKLRDNVAKKEVTVEANFEITK